MDSNRFNTVQLLKRRFFAMRNGIVADTLRRAGSPQRIIFGLTLPQIAEIAAEFGEDAELARQMWANTSTRESSLIAPMLMPRSAMDFAEALTWLKGAPSCEAVDILCHRLLRHLDFAPALAETLQMADSEMLRYAGLRLRFNLLPAGQTEARRAAEASIAAGGRNECAIARRLIDELDFLAGE